MTVRYDLLRLIPDEATHCLVEERQGRGAPVWCVVSIIPGGSSPILNGYSSEELARAVADRCNEWIDDGRPTLTINGVTVAGVGRPIVEARA